MSDFDTVLERLLAEPPFARALAADPATALAGYHLTAEEIDLLSSQVSADAGGQHGVESRANKSSVFGLLSPLAGLAGELTGGGGGLTEHLGGAGGGLVGGAAAGAAGAAGGAIGTGSGPIGASLDGTFGGGQTGFGGIDGFGGGTSAPGPAHEGFGPAPHEGFGPAQEGPAPDGGPAQGGGPADGYLPPPADYHTRVDVDGDGTWDPHILVGRRDGGVDILVDTDHDGRADFVGHDDDADGLVDSADYDKNHDGVFEKTMYDDDGDGWLDRTVRH